MKIQAKKNGPYVVLTAGKYVVRRGGAEETVEQQVLALCRCGGSKDKPFCDGTHRRIGFEAEEVELEIPEG